MSPALKAEKNMPAVIDSFEVRIDPEKIYRIVQKNISAENAKRVNRMIQDARVIAKPKIIYKISSFSEHGYGRAPVIDSITFDGTFPPFGKPGSGPAAPFIITAGREIEEWADGFGDMFHRICADEIGNEILNNAIDCFTALMREKFSTPFSLYFPGFSPEGPLSNQKKIFDIFGECTRNAGLRINESHMISPLKTVAGIALPSDAEHGICEQCAKSDCGKRMT